MSFFGGGGGFDDPFFGDMHRMMRSHMHDLDALMDPFGFVDGGREGRNRSPRQQMIDDNGSSGSNGRRGHREERNSALVQRDPMSSFMQPFGFGLGGGLFGNLFRQMEQAASDPDSHVYTQSTVISMKAGKDGRPQYYEATESMRKAGDVKETRRTIRDSDRGLEKMEIGHHIGNRGHIIEKRRDRTTGGQILENQQFVGVDAHEAERFDQEWSRATRQATNGERNFVDAESSVGLQLAIEGSRSNRRSHMGSPYARGSSTNSPKRRSSYIRQNKPKHFVRVEEPEENEPSTSNSKQRKGGPKIVELD